MGTPVATPGFHKASYLYPPGMLVAWQDARKTVTIFTSISSESTAGSTAAEATAAAVVKADKEQEADDGPPPPPQERPVFTVTAVRGDVEVPEEGTLREAFGDAAVVLASSHATPDDACNELFALAKLAKTLPKASAGATAPAAAPAAADAAAAAASAAAVGDAGDKGEKQERQLATLRGDAALLAVLQEVPLPPVRWPRLLFGLSHAAVLTKLEGHDAVEHCTEYMYVEVSLLTLAARSSQ